MIVRALAAALALAAPARAQSAADLAKKSPEAAAAAIEKTFSLLTAPHVTLPTWEEIQRDRMRRDLTPATSATPRESPQAMTSRAAQNPLLRKRRDSRESLDVALSRPLPRVELGAGWTETTLDDGHSSSRERTWNDAHAFLRVDLSRAAAPRKLLHSPTFLHQRVENSDDRIAVSRGDYDVHSRP